MATAHQIHLSPTTTTGIFSVAATDGGTGTGTGTGPNEASARAASEVLQHDLEHHHVFFNDLGFHNHIVHHILSIYALGASAEEIRAAYERDRAYQRKAIPVDEAVVAELADRNRFLGLLGMKEHYSNFLRFFQREIERVGVEEVLMGFLFGQDDEVARAMLGRLFGGLIHPFIHLGFGLEFEQPAIVAEALAQTAIHEDWTGPMFFWPAEEQAGGVGRRGEKGLLAILEAMRRDETLARSVQWEDGNKMRDGVLARAGEAMLAYAAEYSVSAEQLEERTAEMINTVVYYTSAAQRPSKQIKFDFFYLHSLNSSIFVSKLLALPFLDTQAKCRLLEWKGRLDLLLYVSRGVPELYLEEIRAYPTAHSWAEIFAFCNRHPQDDGHLAKLVRAVAHGERACRPFEAEWPIKGDMWLRIANMGDIGRLADYAPYRGFLQRQTDRFKAVLLILGNHEFYGLSIAAGLDKARQLEPEPCVHGRLIVLNQGRYDVPGFDVSVLGCTLWSHVPDGSREIVQAKIQDFRKIEG